MLDLRERLAVLGEDFRSGVSPENLAAWAAAPVRPFPTWRRLTAQVLALLAAGGHRMVVRNRLHRHRFDAGGW